MVCIPGGPAIVGSDTDLPSEKPRHRVEVSTFYLDQRETTNAEYEACEKDGHCKKRDLVLPLYEPFLVPDLPATPISYSRARQYCAWAGKRLPTEAEWEKAARGAMEARRYPWGDAEPSCDKAQIQGCAPLTPKPVGSFAPSAFGLYDMAGNGYEWVNDWSSACYEGCPKACGDACKGLDPAGPCGGAPDCQGSGKRLLKGGSWYWGPEANRASFRRAEPPEAPHRFGVRCASSTTSLATYPPLAITDPLPRPADPTPPSAEELAVFRSIPLDEEVDKLPLCERTDDYAHCKDPSSYVVSNELEQYVWEPYLKNLGGAFAGVGADQGLSFAAAARSRWVWIFDYDPAVVRLHGILAVLVKAFDTRAGFLSALRDSDGERAFAALDQAYENPDDRRAIRFVFRDIRPTLAARYALQADDPKSATFGWLRTDEAYSYIRLLMSQGRVHVTPGNLLTDKAMPAIAAAARKLGVPVRVFYPSNADDQWELTGRYHENVAGLPMDDRSVVIRSIYARGERQVKGQAQWIYFVDGGLREQEKHRRGYRRIASFMEDSFATDNPLLRVAGLPGKGR